MNIIIMISVISIVALLVYIPLKLSGFLPLKNNMYRPPILPDEWKRLKNISIEDDEDIGEVDLDLIQYWPGLFTDNDF